MYSTKSSVWLVKSLWRLLGVQGVIDVNVRVLCEIVLVLVSLILTALRAGAFRRNGESQFGKFGLLLLETLLSPLDAPVLEPNFDLEKRKRVFSFSLISLFTIVPFVPVMTSRHWVF